jgi:hypothetical protein
LDQQQTVLSDHVIVFARFPTPGATKTRLASAIGDERAAAVSHEMTAETLRKLIALRDLQLCSLEIRVSGGGLADFRDILGPEHSYVPQGTGDLGDRMSRAVDDGFQCGAQKVVLVGSDCPELGVEHVTAALACLEENNVVIGPATDGGYYLLGLSGPTPELFKNIEWGGPNVLEQTLESVARAGATVGMLETLSDVDRPDDLAAWDRQIHRAIAPKPRISVIIPALNEELTISAALSSASGCEIEVIVVDGGSSDRTMEIAAAAGAKVIRASRGRARQMNAGAAMAKGEMLLFLHADTVLPKGFEEVVVQMLDRPAAGLCAFRLALTAHGWHFRLIEALVNLRSRLFKMPYGDQALSIRADLFREVGGFPALPIMEDYALVQRLRRRGRVVISNLAVQTSARRWLARGVWRTTLVNQACIATYRIGVSPVQVLRLREPLDSPSVPVATQGRSSADSKVDSACFRKTNATQGNDQVARERVLIRSGARRRVARG